MNLPKHLHVIGICGVATSALAIAFHNRGVRVTGSDKGFFPPVSTELEKHNIPFYAGWHPDKMVANDTPDLVVIPTASGNNNPETLYTREHHLNSASYTEVFRDYFIKKHSIVCAGTWGKTSSSALLSYILDYAHYDPSYMFGGISISHDASARLSDGEWSVFEGDEYKSGPDNPTAKFFYYKPTHLLLTAVSWDHADLYPTEQSYFDAFRKLIHLIPSSGVIVACTDNPGVKDILNDAGSKKIVTYGTNMSFDYSYSNIQQSKDGIEFEIHHGVSTYRITSPLLGAFQVENLTGCFAMAHSIGVPAEKIIEAISSFKGLKRRLEKRLEGNVTVIDDIAHSPEKAASVLANLKKIYAGKVITIFEPNIGGRRHEAAAKYDNAFRDADQVIIPRLTKLKVAENDSHKPMEGDELANTIAKTHKNTMYVADDAKLVEVVVNESKPGDVIAFLGSHGFRGMIEEVIKKIS